MTTPQPDLSTLDLHVLTSEIRRRGYPVCVFTKEDIVDLDGTEDWDDDALSAFLINQQDRIEEAMAKGGFDVIEVLLLVEGKD